MKYLDEEFYYWNPGASSSKLGIDVNMGFLLPAYLIILLVIRGCHLEGQFVGIRKGGD